MAARWLENPRVRRYLVYLDVFLSLFSPLSSPSHSWGGADVLKPPAIHGEKDPGAGTAPSTAPAEKGSSPAGPPKENKYDIFLEKMKIFGDDYSCTGIDGPETGAGYKIRGYHPVYGDIAVRYCSGGCGALVTMIDMSDYIPPDTEKIKEGEISATNNYLLVIEDGCIAPIDGNPDNVVVGSVACTSKTEVTDDGKYGTTRKESVTSETSTFPLESFRTDKTVRVGITMEYDDCLFGTRFEQFEKPNQRYGNERHGI